MLILSRVQVNTFWRIPAQNICQLFAVNLIMHNSNICNAIDYIERYPKAK